MGWFKWLEDISSWVKSYKSSTSISNVASSKATFGSSEATEIDREELANPTYDNLVLAGTVLKNVTSYAATKTGELASATYQHLSEIDYSYYANQTYQTAIQSAGFVHQTLSSAYESTSNIVKQYREGDDCYDRFDLDDYKPKQSKESKENKEDKGDKEDKEGKKEEFSSDFELICGICLDREKNRVLFPCGHTFCQVCTNDFTACPICRSPINGTMRFYL